MFLFHHFVPFQAEVTYTPTYYCPQVIPDDVIDFTILYAGTDSWYCPQTLPDTSIITGNALSIDKVEVTTTTLDPETFTVTFNTTWVRIWNYTITGVTSEDIGGAPLTGSFTANGQTLTFTATHTADKVFTITIDDEPSVTASVVLYRTFYCPQDTTGFFPIVYEVILSRQTDTDYCPQDITGFYDFDQEP